MVINNVEQNTNFFTQDNTKKSDKILLTNMKDAKSGGTKYQSKDDNLKN